MKNYFIFLLAVWVFISGLLTAQAQIITTVAGIGTYGHSGDGGNAILAQLGDTYGIAIDSSGNIYIADNDTDDNSYIRKINSYGVITTIAGGGSSSGDGGPATLAQIVVITGIAVDNIGNIYIAEQGPSRIRKIDAAGIINTIAGTGLPGYNGDNIPATAAQINEPIYLALDKYGNIYISDYGNSRIRKIDTSGIIYTIAGTGTTGWSGDNGPATLAQIGYPLGIAVDTSGQLYIADGNDRIRKINDSGIITTFAGTGFWSFSGDGGPAIEAEFNYAFNVAVDDSGNVYIDDINNNRIRKVNKAGIISTVAGNGTAGFSGDGGFATDAEVNGILGMAFNKNGNLYFTDTKNYRTRAIVSPLDANAINKTIADCLVYPNPNQGSFNINVTAHSTANTTITITNIIGEKIYETTACANKPVGIVLNVPTGVYLIKATTSENEWDREIIVDR